MTATEFVSPVVEQETIITNLGGIKRWSPLGPHEPPTLRRDVGDVQWTLKPEFGTSGTVNLELSLRPGGKAWDATLESRQRRDPVWSGMPGALRGIEVGHAHGLNAAALVTGELEKSAPRDESAMEILLAGGFTTQHAFDRKNPSEQVTVLRRRWKTNLLTIFLSESALDFDYQARGSTSWYNLLLITLIKVAKPPETHPAQAVYTALTRFDTSPANAARIAMILIEEMYLEGPPERPRKPR
jgi:hypothetical protein